MNIGEDNSTTSGNGQNYVHVDDPDFPQSDITITSTDESGNVIINRNKISTRTTRSYKTELGKMTRRRNEWRGIAFSQIIIIVALIVALIKALQS